MSFLGDLRAPVLGSWMCKEPDPAMIQPEQPLREQLRANPQPEGFKAQVGLLLMLAEHSLGSGLAPVSETATRTEAQGQLTRQLSNPNSQERS